MCGCVGLCTTLSSPFIEMICSSPACSRNKIISIKETVVYISYIRQEL